MIISTIYFSCVYLNPYFTFPIKHCSIQPTLSLYNIIFTLALHLIFNQHYPCMTVTFTITLNWIIHVHYFHFSTHFIPPCIIPPCIIPMYSVSIIPVKNNLGYILSNTPVSNHIITVNTVLSTRLNSILYNSFIPNTILASACSSISCFLSYPEFLSWMFFVHTGVLRQFLAVHKMRPSFCIWLPL